MDGIYDMVKLIQYDKYENNSGLLKEVFNFIHEAHPEISGVNELYEIIQYIKDAHPDFTSEYQDKIRETIVGLKGGMQEYISSGAVTDLKHFFLFMLKKKQTLIFLHEKFSNLYNFHIDKEEQTENPSKQALQLLDKAIDNLPKFLRRTKLSGGEKKEESEVVNEDSSINNKLEPSIKTEGIRTIASRLYGFERHILNKLNKR
jgi:hypothetical protein